MAPVSTVERGEASTKSLSKEDCSCPICLDIFIEPVTLPCKHTFCKVCFLESLDKATLCCPLCRKRVSTWVRHHCRNNTLVNEALSARIQRAFPEITERKLKGQDEDDIEVKCTHRLSEPGAVRQEYEDEVFKLKEEQKALQEQERRASEEFIYRLLEEENELLKEQQKLQEDDERLARLLSQELNSASESDQSLVSETPAKKKPLGQIDRFLCPLSKSPAHNSKANKENILVPLSPSAEPPQIDFYGPESDQSQDEETDWSADQSELDDRPAEGGAKRRSRQACSEEEEETRGKRCCQSSTLVGVAMSEWEVELQRRRRQEEDDLRVALELQRQLDKQDRQTDRRKGSEDAYQLRAPGKKPAPFTATTTPAARKRPHAAAAALSRSAQRKRPPAATATLSSLSQLHTPAPQTDLRRSERRNQAPAAAAALSSLSQLHTAAPDSAAAPQGQTCAFSKLLSPPKPSKPNCAAAKTCLKSPEVQKSQRQATLWDLFNLKDN